MYASDPEALAVHSSGSATAAANGADSVASEAPAAQLDLGFAERTAGSQTPSLDLSDEVVMPTSITKRDGRVVPFDPNRIERAIGRCFAALGRQPYTPIPELALRVVNIMSARRGQPTVERVQDAVELTLQAAGEFEAAKAYILYRAEHAKQRQERPIPEEVRAAFGQADRYFPTPLQKFQFFDKYSRFDYAKGRRETWLETVDRSVAYLHELVTTNTGADLGSDFYERIRRFILEMKSMPSMRLLAMAGPPARRDATAIYNCSYQPVESVDSFAEALLISMAGCGVGFSVERKYVENFPRVQRQRGFDPLRHVIEDSAQGWAEALRLGMHAWFEGRDVQFDYSQIRPAGTPLRTKGGRASGPSPLRTMLEFTRGRLLARQGMHLRPLDAHDIMCMVGNAAVSGGVRRTAMISLFDYDDLEMRLCKSGDFEHDNSQRWNANNSAVWPERGLDQIEVVEQVLDMVKSQRGEPGIFNRKAAFDLSPERRQSLGYTDFGTNPCGEINLRKWQFCVSGDTPLITKDGITNIHEAVGRQIEIWNGKRWAKVTPFQTGAAQQLYRVRFRDGSYLDCTGDHRFSVSNISTRFRKREFQVKTTLELMQTVHRRWATEPFRIEHTGGHLVPQQDAYELGFAVGDGCVERHGGQLRVVADLYGPKDTALPLRGARYAPYLALGYQQERTRLVVDEVIRPERVAALKSADPTSLNELFTWSREAILAFIAGWIDADGSQTPGGGVRLYLSDYERARRLQLLLTKCGIRSSVNLLHQAGTPTNLGVPRRDLWYLQITECSEIPCRRVDTSRGHAARFEGKYQVVVSVEPLPGLHDTFCFTEPEEHKGVFGNALTYQCNLSIAVARTEDTLETLKEKVEVATIIGTIQSLATHFPDLRPMWRQNCEEERLLGVDINGQLDSPAAQDPAVMRALREHVVETNRVLAARLGINQSAATTCVKPSGNSSQLLNCSSGLHARWAPYYERNVRVAATSPIFKVLRDAGVPMDPENGQTREEANCVTPDTRVLTDELRWVPAGDLKKGDGIIGFDDLPGLGKKRHYTRATITFAGRKLSRVVRITLDDGQVLRCTPDHKWLTLAAGGTATWMTAEEMLRNSKRNNAPIRLPRYWNVEEEGCLGAVASTNNIGSIQNEGGVYTRGVTGLEASGYRVVTHAKLGSLSARKDCRQVAVVDGRSELLRVLSEVRPMRLVDKLVSRIHTLSLVAFATPSISSVEEDGEQEIAVLSSSCETYLAEGFAAHNTWVVHFPVKSPEGAITRKDRSAIEQCEYWLRNKLNWTEHNPSVTILYKQDEIIDLTRWIWEHRDFIGGMAFLPTFDAHYAQLPYIEISREEYEKRAASFPEIDFSKIFRYESTDLTNAAQELACLAGQCELD